MADISKINLNGTSYTIKDDTARTSASSAVSTANTAKSTADTAKTTADNASRTATTASQTATTAKSTADSALSKATQNETNINKILAAGGVSASYSAETETITFTEVSYG